MVVAPADRPLTPRLRGIPGRVLGTIGRSFTGLNEGLVNASSELARAAFKFAIAEKPIGRFMIRSRIRVVKRHPEGDW
jgi:hypothetical protein